MTNYTVTVEVEVFEELIRTAERVAVLKRFNDAGMYISSADMLCILGLEQKVEDDPDFYLIKKEEKEDGNNENS